MEPIDINKYIEKDVQITEKPMKFRCADCDKPLYEDRAKQPKWLGCQCVEPKEPVPAPVVPVTPKYDYDYC